MALELLQKVCAFEKDGEANKAPQVFLVQPLAVGLSGTPSTRYGIVRIQSIAWTSMGEQNIGLDSQTDFLQIPQSNDSVMDVARKLIALADVVRRGRSIATATKFAASIIQEKEPVKITVDEMKALGWP